MAQLYSNYPRFWNSNTEQVSESVKKTLSLRVEPSPPQLPLKVRQLSFQLHDLGSSSSQSTRSNHDPNSQDQCISSESGQEVSCGKSAEQQIKPPVFLMGQPDDGASFNPPTQIDYGRAMVNFTDPNYFSGLLAAYGPAPMMVGMTTPARVPLPLDNIAKDEPIYVNAKQYHGILRRRQSRAKLEAENKIIKARKPYLHESRHRHALNRVRGSGGRFLGTKKQLGQGGGSSQPKGPERVTAAVPSNSSSGMSHLDGGSVVFQQPPDRGYPGISTAHIGGGSVLLGDWKSMNNQHYAASVVR
ncbi:hypothetical protein Dimus_026117 [Dionaea muscipula]